ncbi:hypothetical protein CLF_102538 [Clonorchis sinensis]|uniref:Uncharacterized protein n=1 Tax=Clonorchis sinensis TaxID=79923 RepID=G7YN45_CLOSI|nr:hypothetical protein CLF_102538 [Clonorchis sinensis]
MERMRKRAILNHPVASNLIYPAQRGFPPNQSYETTMLVFMDRIGSRGIHRSTDASGHLFPYYKDAFVNERKPLHDKNKSDANSFDKSPDPVFQSMNPRYLQVTPTLKAVMQTEVQRELVQQKTDTNIEKPRRCRMDCAFMGKPTRCHRRGDSVLEFIEAIERHPRLKKKCTEHIIGLELYTLLVKLTFSLKGSFRKPNSFKRFRSSGTVCHTTSVDYLRILSYTKDFIESALGLTNSNTVDRSWIEPTDTLRITYRQHKLESIHYAFFSFITRTTFQMDSRLPRQVVCTKDPLKPNDLINCVQKGDRTYYDCVYIGQTGGYLKVRIDEHKRYCWATPRNARELNKLELLHAMHCLKIIGSTRITCSFDEICTSFSGIEKTSDKTCS